MKANDVRFGFAQHVTFGLLLVWRRDKQQLSIFLNSILPEN